ncbi:MAG: hypothetical protein Q8P78_03100, partial [bacterium]|nr:hypothetical protein [bacterium]
LLSYAISIALLIYSLIVAKGMAVKGGGIADAALGKIKSGGIKLGKLAALGVATGGAGSAIAAAGGLKVADKYKGTAARFLGRKADDYPGRWLTQKAGTGVAKTLEVMGLGKTRLGLAAATASEKGIKFRTLKKGWQARSAEKEEERIAEYEGVSRDLFNGVIDKEKTAYSYRSTMALVNQRAKKQADETDGTTEAFMDILEKSEKKGNKIEGMAAMINLVKQNDFNEVNLTSKFAKDIHKQVLGEMDASIVEDEKRVAKLLEGISQDLAASLQQFGTQESEIKEGVSQSSLVEYEQKMRDSGMSEEEIGEGISSLKSDADMRLRELRVARETEMGKYSEEDQKNAKTAYKEMEDLDEFKRTRKEFEKYEAVDSEIHREVALRKLFGEDENSARFAAKIGNVGLDSGGFNSFGLAGYNEKTGKYEYTRTTSTKGFRSQINAVTGKGRNMSPANIFRAHPGAFRHEVIVKGSDGKEMRTYHDELSGIGQRLFSLALVGNSDRNVSNLRADALAALVGGINISNYPDLYSVDPGKRDAAQRAFFEVLSDGYGSSIEAILGKSIKESGNAIGEAIRRYMPKEFSAQPAAQPSTARNQNPPSPPPPPRGGTPSGSGGAPAGAPPQAPQFGRRPTPSQGPNDERLQGSAPEQA